MYFVFVNAKTRKMIKGFEASNALVIDFIFNEGRKHEIYIQWRTWYAGGTKKWWKGTPKGVDETHIYNLWNVSRQSENQTADTIYIPSFLPAFHRTVLHRWAKLHIPSALNIDLILWHTQLIVCAVKY